LPPETWKPARRAAERLIFPLQSFMAIEAASGLLLIAATAAALVWANSGWSSSYEDLWHTAVGFHLGPWAFSRPLHFWVNDGLMTIFFFVVGLEIRREMYEGELADLRRAALPLAAALGGMVLPAGICAALTVGRAGAAGWGIPMATDIAFAVGVLTLLGSRVPASLRILLLALAVIDDIGAILVIAIFYSGGVSVWGLVIAAAGLASAVALRTIGLRQPLIYVAPGLVVWAGLYISGVHPTVGGVLLGLVTPVRSWFGLAGFSEATHSHLGEIDTGDREALHRRLAAIETARREAISPAERLQHILHPYVAYGVMPLFAFANAGVPLGGADLGGDGLFLFLGILVGLALGKPLGIFAFSAVSTRTGLATRPAGASPRGVALVGIVGGIGFTMSLFIAQLAFPEPGPLLDTAKLAILVASTTAVVVGLVSGLLMLRKSKDAPADTATDDIS
jgi:NhaA family Na+:H+ antiporter